LRILGRAVCWVLAVCGTFAAVVFAVVLVSAEDSDERIGAVALLVAALIVLGGAIAGLRTIPRSGETTAASNQLAEARGRLRTGEPIVLRPRSGRRAWAFLLCLLFTGVAAVTVPTAPSVIAAAGVAMFGLVMLLATVQLIPGRASLRIAREGLVARTPLRTRRWAWNDIEHFRGYEIQQPYVSTKHVGFDRRDLTPSRQGLWRTVSRGMSGVDETLPDTYGLSHDDLAQLLDDARERYATEHGPSASERADRELEAQAALIRQDRVPIVTALLTAACVAVFVNEMSRYGVFPDPHELLDAGGTSRDALAAGQWWTLLSANVVHANPIHLLLNLFGLALAGSLLERELGWMWFGALCLAGGIAAMGLAVLIQPRAVVVGISGVIFAVAGLAVVRDPHRTRALGAVAWSIVPVGVVYTLLTPTVSIGAHLGGLLAGLGLGYAFKPHPRRQQRPAPGL